MSALVSQKELQEFARNTTRLYQIVVTTSGSTETCKLNAHDAEYQSLLKQGMKIAGQIAPTNPTFLAAFQQLIDIGNISQPRVIQKPASLINFTALNSGAPIHDCHSLEEALDYLECIAGTDKVTARQYSNELVQVLFTFAEYSEFANTQKAQVMIERLRLVQESLIPRSFAQNALDYVKEHPIQTAAAVATVLVAGYGLYYFSPSIASGLSYAYEGTTGFIGSTARSIGSGISSTVGNIGGRLSSAWSSAS